MTALDPGPAVAPWGWALRLGRRDVRLFPLRAVLVLVLVAVATAMMTIPGVMLARALTPGTVLGVSGSLHGGQAPNQVTLAGLVIYGIVAALAVLQAVLLITPAFLIGVRRRVRELGLLSATGARPADIRRVILAPALLCGAPGALLGAGGAFALIMRAIPAGSTAELAAAGLAAFLAAAVGVAIAVGAAWYPAVLAVRLDPVRAIGDVQPPTAPASTPDWVPAAGFTALAAGAALAALGAAQQEPISVVGGVALAEVGIVLLAAAALGGLERVRARAALAAYVLRDAARHRVRVLPAIAASLTMVAAATAALTFQSTQHASELAMYSGEPSLFPSDVRTGAVLVAASVVAVVLVTWVTAALAAQETRPDLEVLEVLGAPGRTRRLVAAAQAGLVAVGAVVCGVPTGLALAVLVVQFQALQVVNGGRPAPPVVVPWIPVLVLVVAVPAVVSLLAALTSPTGAKLTRHVDR